MPQFTEVSMMAKYQKYNKEFQLEAAKLAIEPSLLKIVLQILNLD